MADMSIPLMLSILDLSSSRGRLLLLPSEIRLPQEWNQCFSFIQRFAEIAENKSIDDFPECGSLLIQLASNFLNFKFVKTQVHKVICEKIFIYTMYTIWASSQACAPLLVELYVGRQRSARPIHCGFCANLN